MKRCCKNIDITDREFIRTAVYECLKGKMARNDVLKMFHEYTGVPIPLLKKIAKDKQYKMFDQIIETVVDGVRQEITDWNIVIKKIWYAYRREGLKIRRIGVQDIKQQIYDYIAVNGLKELLEKKIGFYQCAAIPGKGQVMGMRAIKRWIRNKAYRYAWKCDVKHYYESIPQEKLLALIEKYVKNKMLVNLVSILVKSFEKGLSIGSYLSQYLANFYMSFAYHKSTENLYKIRKCRDGTRKRVRMVYKVLIYMDDILFLGKSLKDLKLAAKQFTEWIKNTLSLLIKENDKYIDMNTGYIDMMGFKICRNKISARSRIFIKFRRSIKEIKKHGIKNTKSPMRVMSRYGWIKNADCKHFMKKNKYYSIINLCKEAISSENDIRYKTA